MLATIDHIVIATADLERCLDSCTRVPGMKVERYGKDRIALTLGPHG
jgi:catechol 2,3-dioxygenase-like lactoylglutathione lyase family enzyme